MIEDQDLHELMLAYAADLADADDRRAAEALLASGDAAARRALAEAREVVAALAASVDPVEASDDQWRRLEAKLTAAAPTEQAAQGTRPAQAAQTAPAALPMRQPGRFGWPALAAAAALAAGVTLGTSYLALRPRLGDTAAAEAAAEDARAEVLVEQRRVDELAKSFAAQQAVVQELRIELDRRVAESARASASAEARAAELNSLTEQLADQRQRLATQREQLATQQEQLASQTAHIAELTREVERAGDDLRLALAPESRLAALGGTDARPEGRGNATLNRTAGRLQLVVAQLEPPQPGQIYQAWALPEGGAGPISLGTFEVGPDGAGTYDADLPDLPDEVNALAVSLEPVDGTPAPDGPIVLTGELR